MFNLGIKEDNPSFSKNSLNSLKLRSINSIKFSYIQEENFPLFENIMPLSVERKESPLKKRPGRRKKENKNESFQMDQLLKKKKKFKFGYDEFYFKRRRD